MGLNVQPPKSYIGPRPTTSPQAHSLGTPPPDERRQSTEATGRSNGRVEYPVLTQRSGSVETTELRNGRVENAGLTQENDNQSQPDGQTHVQDQTEHTPTHETHIIEPHPTTSSHEPELTQNTRQDTQASQRASQVYHWIYDWLPSRHWAAWVLVIGCVLGFYLAQPSHSTSVTPTTTAPSKRWLFFSVSTPKPGPWLNHISEAASRLEPSLELTEKCIDLVGFEHCVDSFRTELLLRGDEWDGLFQKIQPKILTIRRGIRKQDLHKTLQGIDGLLDLMIQPVSTANEKSIVHHDNTRQCLEDFLNRTNILIAKADVALEELIYDQKTPVGASEDSLKRWREQSEICVPILQREIGGIDRILALAHWQSHIGSLIVERLQELSELISAKQNSNLRQRSRHSNVKPMDIPSDGAIMKEVEQVMLDVIGKLGNCTGSSNRVREYWQSLP